MKTKSKMNIDYDDVEDDEEIEKDEDDEDVVYDDDEDVDEPKSKQKPSSIRKEVKETPKKEDKQQQVLTMPKVVSLEEMFNILYEQNMMIISLLSKKNE